MKKGIVLFLVIIMCTFLVGCGGKNEKIVDNNETNITNNQEQNDNSNENNEGNSIVNETEKLREEELNNTKEAVENMELYSDDNKYVFKTSDNTTGIFYHNGNEITGYEIRVNFESHELAEIAKSEYLKEYQDQDVKSIDVNGNELIIKFGPKEYEDLTLDSIKMTYSMFQVIKGKE